MPLPDEVKEYVELKKKEFGKSWLSPSSGSLDDGLANPHGPNYMRGYVGNGHRMSGEEADRQLMELMKNW